MSFSSPCLLLKVVAHLKSQPLLPGAYHSLGMIFITSPCHFAHLFLMLCPSYSSLCLPNTILDFTTLTRPYTELALIIGRIMQALDFIPLPLSLELTFHLFPLTCGFKDSAVYHCGLSSAPRLSLMPYCSVYLKLVFKV